MMNFFFYLLTLVGAIFLGSCEKLDSSNSSNEEEGQSLVYRERDPNYPLILSRPREKSITRAVELGFGDVLGRSFKLDYFPFENMLNVGLPVVDLAKLDIDKPGWATKMPLRLSTAIAFSYSTFDRYEENSSITKKISTGFQINFGLFKIGNKNTYYKHFTSTLIQSNNSVFGQLDIEVKDAVYNLTINSNRLNMIRKQYLDKDFVGDLYNLHPQELFSFYGPLVMTNFITGGRATALFAGITKTEAVGEMREKTMNSEISASFSFKKDSSNYASLGFGKGFTNGSASTETFTQLYSILTTSGGDYGLGAFTTPKSIDDMNIDLSAWANSLNNTDNHAVVNIQDNGLVPLSAFFIELNLKEQYKRYVAGEDLSSKKFVEPRLVHIAFPNHQHGLFMSGMYLITRFNDAILVRQNMIPLDDRAKQELDDRFHELCDKYRIKAEIGSVNFVNFNSRIQIADGITTGNFINGLSIESKMKKYLDANNEILYLLYNENSKKVGYTIYMGKGDYLLDTYGIRHWVDTLPVTTVSDNELLGYTLIAL